MGDTPKPPKFEGLATPKFSPGSGDPQFGGGRDTPKFITFSGGEKVVKFWVVTPPNFDDFSGVKFDIFPGAKAVVFPCRGKTEKSGKLSLFCAVPRAKKCQISVFFVGAHFFGRKSGSVASVAMSPLRPRRARAPSSGRAQGTSLHVPQTAYAPA